MMEPSASLPSKSCMLRRQGVPSPPDTMITGGTWLAMWKVGMRGELTLSAPPSSTLRRHQSRHTTMGYQLGV